MAGWENTTDMAEALPTTDDGTTNGAAAGEAPAPERRALVLKDRTTDIQEHGWVAKSGYDYEEYNKTNQQLHDDAAASGVVNGEWAANADRYEWKEEYGDVGPEFPELEKQLFGSDLHVRSGIDFSA